MTEQVAPPNHPQNDPIPQPPATSSGTAAAQSFHGNIATLRQANLANNSPVTLDDTVVTSISGNGKTVYVSDPEGGAFSGIEVDMCKTAPCNGVPQSLLGEYKVQGTYLVTADGVHASLGTPTLTLLDPGPAPLLPYQTTADEVSETATHNGDVVGTWVSVDYPGEAQVSSVTAASFLNTSYTSDMENACRGTGVAIDTSQCCPSGVGPKYFGFEVQVGNDTIGISTGNYPSKANGENGSNLAVWPCNGDFSSVITTNTFFTGLGGIYDINFGLGSISPATDSDYVIAP